MIETIKPLRAQQMCNPIGTHFQFAISDGLTAFRHDEGRLLRAGLYLFTWVHAACSYVLWLAVFMGSDGLLLLRFLNIEYPHWDLELHFDSSMQAVPDGACRSRPNQNAKQSYLMGKLLQTESKGHH
ncbi:MAG: hypothetical protein ABJN35_08635 [Erythrobacter sp.]